jgi:hypothetical protein
METQVLDMDLCIEFFKFFSKNGVEFNLVGLSKGDGNNSGEYEVE